MLAIMKKDFRGYFLTPLGYVFCALFAVIMNVFFTFDNLRGGISNIKPLFVTMMYIFSFLVPVLTMRTFSEEYKLKTDQLLLCAPIGTASVVLGKFFAVVLVVCAATAFTLPYPIIIAIVSSLPLGEIVGCYVGLLLAVSAFVAIGVFISGLTENQIIAASGSIGVFILLPFIDYLYALNSPFLIKIADVLNFTMRFSSNFISGVLSLNDILYYVSVIAIFLFLTVRVLEKKRYS